MLQTALVAVGAAALSAWLTPRGPITTAQALGTMATALLVGLIGGLVLCSRWSILLIPAMFALVFELIRMNVSGPTVDGIMLNSTYGIIAFITGRLSPGILALAPMALGAGYGNALASRLSSHSTHRISIGGRFLAGITTLALLGIAVAVGIPATTNPIFTAP